MPAFRSKNNIEDVILRVRNLNMCKANLTEIKDDYKRPKPDASHSQPKRNQKKNQNQNLKSHKDINK